MDILHDQNHMPTRRTLLIEGSIQCFVQQSSNASTKNEYTIENTEGTIKKDNPEILAT